MQAKECVLTQSSDLTKLSAELAPPVRLAVAYAPKPARGVWTALLVLDRRLARAALEPSEPMLGQIRLAWYRDRLSEPPGAWPAGEPLLASLAPLVSEIAALWALVDAWEAMVGGAPGTLAIAALADARAEAIVALARALGCASRLDRVQAMARWWARADLARVLDTPAARDLAAAAETRASPLPRAMRPLVILMDLPRWDAVRPTVAPGLRALARIVRLGMIGR